MFKRLKTLREEKHFSQDYVSQILGCSRSNYAMYESGRINTPVEQISKLAELYDVSVEYLIELTDSPNDNKKFCQFNKATFIDNVVKLRKSKNLHQLFIANNVLKCTQAAYSQYESGRRNISIDTLVALCKYYDVTADCLIGREVEE